MVNEQRQAVIIGRYYLRDNPMVGTEHILRGIVPDSLCHTADDGTRHMQELNSTRGYDEMYKCILVSSPTTGIQKHAVVIGHYLLKDNPMVGTEEMLVGIVPDSLRYTESESLKYLNELNSKRGNSEMFKIISLASRSLK